MPDAQFESLRLELLKAASPPSMSSERSSSSPSTTPISRARRSPPALRADEAARTARAALGNEQAIRRRFLRVPELLTFSTRWPRVAHCLHSAAAIGTLPGCRSMFCIEHRPELARWGAPSASPRR